MPTDNVHRFLNKLTFNQKYLDNLMDEPTPCLSIGILQERKKEVGFILLRPDEDIPENVTNQGFQLGNRMVGADAKESVIQLSFAFYDYGVYHGLVNPSNPVVKRTVELMVKNEDYLFIVINPSQRAVTFRSELGKGDYLGIHHNMDMIRNAVTSNENYELIFDAFENNPSPPGKVVPWVCREDKYSDLSDDVVVIGPA
ncbi:MAG: hypothetical protein OEY58_19720 [Gammaproteobacteria bacterium]|nr:hypothetical protein [Gammaproteobacteria bacterium]